MANRTARNIFVFTIACASLGICFSMRMPHALATPQSTNAAQGQAATAKIVKAANVFLDTLSPEQRKSVLFAFNDEQQRARWSNLPTSFVRRAGLNMGALTEKQRAAAMILVSSALSKRGFEKVEQIVEADETLKKNEGDNPMFGKDLYYISFLGTPSEKEPWMLQYGGHHLGLNITISGTHGILTPSLIGAQPSVYTSNGKTIRPLGAESDKALALLNALDDTQRKQAILEYRVADLVLGPGRDGRKIVPEGLKASAMTEKQQAMLLDLIGEWTGFIHESAAVARLAEVKADLKESYFAWSGPTTVQPGRNISAYYRIQGPKIVVEYSPQRMGGDPSMHIHAMYRDPTNDYGKGLTAK